MQLQFSTKPSAKVLSLNVSPHTKSPKSETMLASNFRRAAAAVRPALTRSFATGPASGGSVSDEMLQKLGSLSTQALVDGLWVMGWPSAQIDGARPLAPGMKCVGRAVTLKFVPARPDIAQDKPPGGESPEYEAFEKCGPNEVR
jgi:hypothetical protein